MTAIPKVVFPVDEATGVVMSPYRHRLVPSSLIIIKGKHLRIDVHLTDKQLRLLHRQISKYLA